MEERTPLIWIILLIIILFSFRGLFLHNTIPSPVFLGDREGVAGVDVDGGKYLWNLFLGCSLSYHNIYTSSHPSSAHNDFY